MGIAINLLNKSTLQCFMLKINYIFSNFWMGLWLYQSSMKCYPSCLNLIQKILRGLRLIIPMMSSNFRRNYLGLEKQSHYQEMMSLIQSRNR